MVAEEGKGRWQLVKPCLQDKQLLHEYISKLVILQMPNKECRAVV